MLHNGYEETLKAFDVASKNTIPSIYIAQENGFGEQHIAYALAQRKAVRQVLNCLAMGVHIQLIVHVGWL